MDSDHSSERPEAVFGLDHAKDIDIVSKVREEIGDQPELIVDTPGARNLWDLDTAIQRFRDLEPYTLRWIEQPRLRQRLALLNAATSASFEDQSAFACTPLQQSGTLKSTSFSRYGVSCPSL